MKKIISIIMILVVIFAFGGCAFVEIKEKGVGVARFIYDGENISADISERDLETIFNIFEGKNYTQIRRLVLSRKRLLL